MMKKQLKHRKSSHRYDGLPQTTPDSESIANPGASKSDYQEISELFAEREEPESHRRAPRNNREER